MRALEVALMFAVPQLALGATAAWSVRTGHPPSARVVALHAVTLLATAALAIPGALLFAVVHPMLGWGCTMAPFAVALVVVARIVDRGSGLVFRLAPAALLVAVLAATAAAVAYRLALFTPITGDRMPGLEGPMHARWACAAIAVVFEFNAVALVWLLRRRRALATRRPLYLSAACALIGAATFALLARMYDAPWFLKSGPPAPILAPMGAALWP